VLEKQIQIIANEIGIRQKQVENTLALFQEGATIPFVARYRKEVTGGLDEVQIGDIKTQFAKLQELEKRREAILKSIQEQGKLSDELRLRIEQVWSLTVLEDIYLPYKLKRKTRASMAKEKGLEPLALEILLQKSNNVAALAQKFITDSVKTTEEALQGARDIIAEHIAESENARQTARIIFQNQAQVTAKLVKGKEIEGAKFKDYFEFSQPLKNCPSHRILALRRGEEEGFLRLSIVASDENLILEKLDKLFLTANNEAAKQVELAIADAFDRLIAPSMETEFRNISKEKADTEAITVFADNLKQLLLLAPLGQKRVLGIDPGFRTGCKVVCLDALGNLLHNTTIFPHPPQFQEQEAKEKLTALVQKYQIDAIAIGNGTAGRETETLCNSIRFEEKVQIFSVNEAGASIYSASEVAREEFPDQDITVRGAISIGRRLIDPLAELVKIDPKSIGVGQYQHDVNQSALKNTLDTTVESAVNLVGVNLNTASRHLLTYVSGLGPALAQAIVTYRTANGEFPSRNTLKKVPRLGDKAYEQCAGFLRIRGAKNPLDATSVHPEAYPIVEKMAADFKTTVADLIQNAALRKTIVPAHYVTDKIGLPTLNDIMKELDKPGLDPRGEAKAFSFADVHSFGDLKIGQVLPGIVTNLTNFGAFVDIGVKQDGLVHISQMANRFIKNPMEVVKLRQEVQVKVIEIDIARKRIMLSMKDV
jgi:protein Tex